MRTYQLDVALLPKFPRDEGAHLGVLFPSVQRRTRRESKLQIRAARLAQCGLSSFIVEDIVHKLQNQNMVRSSDP